MKPQPDIDDIVRVKRAVATPKSNLDLVSNWLARAREDYEAWLRSR